MPERCRATFRHDARITAPQIGNSNVKQKWFIKKTKKPSQEFLPRLLAYPPPPPQTAGRSAMGKRFADSKTGFKRKVKHS